MVSPEDFPATLCELSIVFCDNAYIQRLNRDFRKKDKPTDVLSFPQLEQRSKYEPAYSLGDLVISVDKTASQAKERRHGFETELWKLLIHGLLHLLGYDHEKVPAKEAQRMRRKEREVFDGFFREAP